MTVRSSQRSWVTSANGHADFPLQNLPLGIFNTNSAKGRFGVAIGDRVLDLHAGLEAGLFEDDARTAVEATLGGLLNDFFELGFELRGALRTRLMELLKEGSLEQSIAEALGERLLPLASNCEMQLPAQINDYTDFYVGIEHAKNVGKLFRPDNPLMSNYKYVPIGYHGRASTIRTSGTQVRRPQGQMLLAGHQHPVFGPSSCLDYELELGVWIGSGNDLGYAISIADAPRHIAGLCLLNDWSARDIQAWEYQPLGPFLSKSFITSVSPWVVTVEALEPFRRPQPTRPESDPKPLAYLQDEHDQATGAFDIELEVLILTQAMKDQGLLPCRLALSNTLYMYWTVAQMIGHHTVSGCQLQAGDLFGTGTLSGPEPGQFGSLLEITEGGQKPIVLPSGETRTFLEDGDEIIFRGRCNRDGFASIGFGECRGKVVSAQRG